MFNFLLPQKFETIDAPALAKILENPPQNVLFVDVREKSEWDEGHIKGFEHIPLGTLDAHADRLMKSDKVYFQCRSGGRSSRACAFLAEGGYNGAVNLSGGIIAWIGHGFPVEK